MAKLPPMIAPQNAPRHRAFAIMFADPALDPCQGQYQRILECFDPETNPAISHVMLLEQTTGSWLIPLAYLCCASCQQHTRVYCIHCIHSPSKFVSSLNGDTTSWDVKSFAYLGDIIQGIISTITLPNNSFRTVNTVRVKTVEFMCTKLDLLTDYGFPANAADAADTSIVTT